MPKSKKSTNKTKSRKPRKRHSSQAHNPINDKTHILNPSTGRYVLRRSRKGKEIVREQTSCPQGKVYNPENDRCYTYPGARAKEFGLCPPKEERNPKTGRCNKVSSLRKKFHVQTEAEKAETKETERKQNPTTPTGKQHGEQRKEDSKLSPILVQKRPSPQLPQENKYNVTEQNKSLENKSGKKSNNKKNSIECKAKEQNSLSNKTVRRAAKGTVKTAPKRVQQSETPGKLMRRMSLKSNVREQTKSSTNISTKTIQKKVLNHSMDV